MITLTTIGNASLPGEPIMLLTDCRVGAHVFGKLGAGGVQFDPWDVCACMAMCYDGVPTSVPRWWSREGDGPWVEHRR